MYDLIVIKPKKFKKKVIIYCIVIAVIVIVSAFLGIYVAKLKNRKFEIYAGILEEQANLIEEETRTEEKMRRKNIFPLMDEQVNNILNIYNDTGEKRVFLTFDDGPSNTVTPLILDVLKEKNVKATFFVLGNRVKSYPEIINRMYNEGHYIGNHGYSHKYSQIYESIDSALFEYNKTEQAIKEALGNQEYNSRIFRFPGGLNGGVYKDIKQGVKERLIENNIAYLNWNALTNDSGIQNPTRETIMQNLSQTSEGKNSIVLLMHDASSKILTYETLPDVIEFYTQRGYNFYNIYDLL
ncbi:MAG: polysaccharide deacetylase family protein [Clostridia bacterium]|nr:polysaccharide deacetylase family protein [Clostridia bacterium]